MALESVTNIDDLVATNPAAGDDVAEGDDHIRNIKTALLNNFTGITGAVNATQAELNENDRSAQAATDHLLMLRAYLYNGSTAQTANNIVGVVTESTFESYGPTGSGATNIWTALDNMSSDAKSVKMALVLNVTATAAGPFGISIFARPGNVAWSADNSTQIGRIRAEAQAANDDAGITLLVEVPLDTADRTFDITWTGENDATRAAFLVYKGFSA